MATDTRQREYDAVVVGAGPNGLAAAIRLAQAGKRVLLVERRSMVGGALASAEVTLPGFIHDLGSAIHPLGPGSPFLRSLPLAAYGLRWIHPPAAVAHPLDDRPAVLLHRSIAQTAAELGRDERAYRWLMTPLVRGWDAIAAATLAPLLPPRHPLVLGAFGVVAGWPASTLADLLFREPAARALIAGLAGHSVLPLEALASASFGLVLGALGHVVGWPFPAGGAQQLANAMADYFRDLGGEIATNWEIHSLDDLPRASATLLDVTPRQLLDLAGDRFPDRYRRALARYRYGPGAFKIDWALAGPIPWADPRCLRSATVHLGGTLEEIAAAERQVKQGQLPERPYVLLAQHSLFDPSRAPTGQHTAWAYCHVPNGSQVDMTNQIEDQIERFAPGFRRQILARYVSSPAALQAWNPNLVGGDVGGGSQDLWQVLVRPVISTAPYRTPLAGVYLCSSSTPPGGGVHGMCGWHAANCALNDTMS
ncbi:MAG: NAD(P)/FAD-dependent oxidoreductase [Roseiflexaceae bacterium]